MFVYYDVFTIRYISSVVLQVGMLPMMRSSLLFVINSIRFVEIKKLLLSAVPFLCYLVLFSFNKQISHFTGLDRIVSPNLILLGEIEKTVFFCHPHRILSTLANPLFDALAAIPYLVHFPLPFIFGFYLLITPRKRPFIYQYFWFAGWVNLLAVIFQILFPTAPPWYVDSAVMDGHHSVFYTSAVEGGFHRLDSFLNIHIFHRLYSTSPLPFGAFPSLHCAWPAVILLCHPWGGWKVGVVHVLWISLSAMYITHHYLVDILGGITLAAIVRLCILKIGSPFPELSDSSSPNKSLSANGKPNRTFAV